MHDIIVIDIGKTNSKVIRFESEHCRCLAAYTTVTPRVSVPYPCLDDRALFGWLTDTLGKLHEPERVGWIVPISHGAAFALIDPIALTLPIMDYEANIPTNLYKAYEVARPPFAVTGSPSLPQGQNAGRQLYWQRTFDPHAWERTTAILALPQYIGWRLTGGLASEVSALGCHTDLWEPDSGSFSSLAHAIGVAARAPPLRPANTTLGPLLPHWQRQWRFDSACKVLVGAHDSNADLAAYLHDEEPLVLLSTGTWAVAMALNCGNDPFAHEPDRLVNVAIDGRPVPTARFMGGRMYAAALAGDDIGGELTDCEYRIAKQLISPGNSRKIFGAVAVAVRIARLLTRVPPGTRLFISGPFADNPDIYSAVEHLTPQLRIAQKQVAESGAAVGAAMLAARQLSSKQI